MRGSTRAFGLIAGLAAFGGFDGGWGAPAFRFRSPRRYRSPEIPRDDAGHLAAAEAKRQRKAAKRDACRCQRCGELRAKRRRQNTAYHDDTLNFAILCEPCQQEADEGWDSMWREIHAEQRASLSL